MYCEYCSNNNIDDARFCKGCGKSINQFTDYQNTTETILGAIISLIAGFFYW